MMWRWMILLLVMANGGFWLWGQGQLRALGWGPVDVAEPARLKSQIHPETLIVKPLETSATLTPTTTAAPSTAPSSATDATMVAPSTPSTAQGK